MGGEMLGLGSAWDSGLRVHKVQVLLKGVGVMTLNPA